MRNFEFLFELEKSLHAFLFCTLGKTWTTWELPLKYDCKRWASQGRL